MHRFFIDSSYQPGDVIALAEDVVRHLHVLRLHVGESLIIFNGQGGENRAQLVELNRRAAFVQVGEFRAIETEPPYQITLAQGIAGGDKMDWLIEKAIELGVARIAPLLTARSVVRLSDERAQRRQTHWQAMARAACAQCGRNRIPEIAAPRTLNAWLDQLPMPGASAELRLMLSPRANMSFDAVPTVAPNSPVTLLIGPEGGLAPDEEEAAIRHDFLALSVGPRILRTETAGLAMLAALAARWGGW